jgi:hypothetical protein
MRVESVTAHAFGPLTEQRLDLAPGLTVVAGANESAKSSWHAAIYAALCGRRRGRGASTIPERRFAELHKPWHGKEWRVSSVLELDDGRRVELTHDLLGKVACRATDLVLGRDVSDEVMFEGSPDASRWLGLDRKSFAATACVGQAELLSVLAAADGLQEHLQRAAATAGADATAASALERLEVFQRDHVGPERANSTKPLQLAKNRLHQARMALDGALSEHQQYLDLVEEAERSRAEADRAAEHAQRTEAVADALEELLVTTRDCSAAQEKAKQSKEKVDAHAVESAKEERRLERTRELAARFGGTAPVGLVAQEQVTQTVNRALAAWRAAPTPRQLTGSTAAELRAELAAVPEPPTGDLAVDDRVRALAITHERALAVASAHSCHEPPVVSPNGDVRLSAALAAGPATVRELAAVRHAPAPTVHPRSTQRMVLFGLAGAAALAGLAALATGQWIPGTALLVPALFVCVLWMVESATAPRSSRHAGEPDADVAARCAILGLPTEPAMLHDLAVRAEKLIEFRAARIAWEGRQEQCAADVTRLAAQLRAALADRGFADPDTEPVDLLATYERSCAVGARQAIMAARSDVLAQALAERERAETAAVETEVIRAEAMELMRQAVRAADKTAEIGGMTTSGELLALLGAWQRGWEGQLRAADEERNAWSELTTLLDGSTLDDLTARFTGRKQQHATLVRESQQDADDAAVAVARRDLLAAACEVTGDVEPLLAEAHATTTEALARAKELMRSADELGGAVAERRRGLPGVPEAEEAFAQAQEKLAELAGLATTLTLTKKFLAAAQDRVHRDIAPTLAATLRTRLPGVTDGRYTDATVDPATLRVTVCGPTRQWRPADNLSIGTAEQVYLLLRFALAEHLSTTGETCPLLLDDITVQADDTRTEAILNLVHQVSADRQVVLFAQETAVLNWARTNLDNTRDALRELSPVPVA